MAFDEGTDKCRIGIWGGPILNLGKGMVRVVDDNDGGMVEVGSIVHGIVLSLLARLVERVTSIIMIPCSTDDEASRSSRLEGMSSQYCNIRCFSSQIFNTL